MYLGKIQHTYTGSTPVTEKKWQDLMKKAQISINK